MKNVYITSLLGSILLISCSSNSSITQTSESTGETSPVVAQDPEWPHPNWQSDPTARIENGMPTAFKTDRVTEITFVVPADWEKLANTSGSLLCKSPTVENQFANLIINSSNTKPTFLAPMREFDYSGFEPEAALKHYLAHKTEDPAAGRVQLVAIDGIWGVLEQLVFNNGPTANSEPRPPDAVWKWVTFMKVKDENNKIQIGFSYPLSEMEKFRPLIAAITNSAKIKRMPGVTMIESQPN